MNLRDYLLENDIKQAYFSALVETSRSHMSCIIAGSRNPGARLAHRISRATNGEIKAKDLLSGEALGYEGKRKRVGTKKAKEKILRDESKTCKKVFSLL